MSDKELLWKIHSLICSKLEVDPTVENAFEASGGNYDDAYSLGINVGEYHLAQQIMTIMDGKERG